MENVSKDDNGATGIPPSQPAEALKADLGPRAAQSRHGPLAQVSREEALFVRFNRYWRFSEKSGHVRPVLRIVL